MGIFTKLFNKFFDWGSHFVTPNKSIEKWKIKIEESSYRTYSENDLKIFLREISIKSTIGEINLTPDISRLDKKTIKKCKNISKKGMVIGGSVLLKACGLLNRDIGDIDVLWDIDKAKNEGIINKNNIINSWSEGYGTEIKRYKVKVKGLGELDIFQKNELENSNIINDIRWGDPIVAMSIKFSYYREKDHKDFYKIKEILNIL